MEAEHAATVTAMATGSNIMHNPSPSGDALNYVWCARQDGVCKRKGRAQVALDKREEM